MIVLVALGLLVVFYLGLVVLSVVGPRRMRAKDRLAVLEGTAPGAAALDPVREYTGDEQIGAAWLVTERDGRTITWHNGGTGGFSTWLGLDREAGTAVVLVSATPESVDDAGFDLLLDQTEAAR